MSHVKSAGRSNNVHNNAGPRLGLKRFGGQLVHAGEVLVRQTGSTKLAGPGTYLSKNYTIHAAQDGIVSFKKLKKSRFTGKTARRTQVVVEKQAA